MDTGSTRPGRGADADTPSTRDRILDVALRQFTEKGFDATSLQEIADELGVTKAALYYHFKSKDDILVALHMRMHELGRHTLERLDEEPVTLELWESLLSSLIEEMLAQRPLFLMHERNQAVMERLHRGEVGKDHDAQHDDLQGRLRAVLSDPAISLRDRVRMACSFGAIFSVVFIGVVGGGDDTETEAGELAPLLREALHDLLRPRQEQ